MTEREQELELLLKKKDKELSLRDAQIALLKEELYLARHRLFGRKSEAAIIHNLLLFDEAPIGIVEKPTDQGEIQVAAHLRARKVGRKPLPEALPRTEIIHDIPEEDKHCACGQELVKIGEEVTERLAIIPRKVYVERHVRIKYACHACEGSGDEDRPAVRIAPAVPSMIPKSLVTPSLLATILTAKYVDHLPFYRQEEQFARDGLDLSRQDMSNWTLKCGLAVDPLVELLEQVLLKGPLIQMDETTLQVLGEKDRSNTAKSYMWLARGGPPGRTVNLYRYHPTRSARHPSQFLENYLGYIQADGYDAYEIAVSGKDIVLVGCWAHARRKFDEAAKASKTPALAAEALQRIRALYALEKQLRSRVDQGELSLEDFAQARREQAVPLLANLREWMLTRQTETLPSSLVGKAFAYALGQWDKLVRYLDLPELTPDNNACENAIRPFVLGRKNWLFSGSPSGARASCNLYTLIETAKANGLEPWAYLNRLFEQLPLTPPEDLASLLPFSTPGII